MNGSMNGQPPVQMYMHPQMQAPPGYMMQHGYPQQGYPYMPNQAQYYQPVKPVQKEKTPEKELQE